MATHKFTPTRFYNVIGTAEPVFTVGDGDTVVTTTLDAAGFDEHGKQLGELPNPMTGPFFVTGAEPGDTLQVRIERMTPNRATGWTFSMLASNVVEPGAVRRLPERERVDWQIEPRQNTVRLASPPERLREFVAPLAPMIGCFGVAPASGQALSTATSGPNGGNMDYRGFGPGVTVFFPVSVPGALFYLGDGHACAGRRRDRRHRHRDLVRDRVHREGAEGQADRLAARRERRGHLCGRQRPPARPGAAARHDRDARWLAADYGLDATAASHILGQAVRYDIANVFNPAYSVACRLAKRWLI